MQNQPSSPSAIEEVLQAENPEGIPPSQTTGMNASVQNADEEEWNVGKAIVLVVLGLCMVGSVFLSTRDLLTSLENEESGAWTRHIFWPALSIVLFSAVLFFHHHKRNWRKGTAREAMHKADVQ